MWQTAMCSDFEEIQRNVLLFSIPSGAVNPTRSEWYVSVKHTFALEDYAMSS
jgi:hypothetical protein